MEYECTGWGGLKAADKNTNERSQVENVSTVLLIDLTDTSSVSRRRERVTWPSALLKCRCSLSLGCLKARSPPDYLLVFPLPLFFISFHALALSKYCFYLFVLRLPIHLSFTAGPPLFISKHKHTQTLFHFRGYLSDPIPIAPSPKSLLHQRKSVLLSAGADIRVCWLTL